MDSKPDQALHLFDLEGNPFDDGPRAVEEPPKTGLRLDPLSFVLGALRRRWFLIGLVTAVRLVLAAARLSKHLELGRGCTCRHNWPTQIVRR